MDPRFQRITDHTYELPAERIALRPLQQRDHAKLLVWQAGQLHDRSFADLAEELPQGSLLVLNDTRVIHARIPFRRATGALIECMVLSPGVGRTMEQALMDGTGTRWWCMLGNAKRWKGEELVLEREGHRFGMRKVAQEQGEYLIEFIWGGEATFLEQLDRFGVVPLPPYMHRPAEAEDDARYNTVFAQHPGSVAAPTASLHFTPQLLETINGKGIGRAQVTLHVGAGTFLPVKSATMQDHRMHSEQLHIPRTAVQQLLEQQGRGPVVPVGTTAMRTVESLYWFGADLALGVRQEHLRVGQWRPYEVRPEVPVGQALTAVLQWLDHRGLDAVPGTTTLLIAPGYRFRMADALITNFHQPHSTLLLLVAAFIGPRWREVYAHALAQGYRFLSYGDGSLLWKE
ncbi:MAG: S-adenosylmethionine:tRNA ribosyltransferase-isomerase [Flavobacteriales bacterium]|nr:S-adenosylmethionine:tRNA ribosyltransferase-isomerase [Flavobacteriales bacterium]MBP9079327.1 S-adenosylmethionine:tRNA ribosyltransferase-isomerase [Flavobacteriales bacterium]